MKKINSIAFCCDGNRRWAKSKKKEISKGHSFGAQKILEVVDWCKEEKIKDATFYIFSTENWKRSPQELKSFFSLFEELFSKKLEEIEKKDANIFFVGERKKIPKKILKILEDFEKKHKHKKNRLNVFLALSYGGRAEILDAIKKLGKNLSPEKMENLTEKKFEKFLWTEKISDPEIVIRTGGAQRLSNFLLWKSAYSEIFFLKKMWPAFSKKDFKKVLKDFENVKINKGK